MRKCTWLLQPWHGGHGRGVVAVAWRGVAVVVAAMAVAWWPWCGMVWLWWLRQWPQRGGRGRGVVSAVAAWLLRPQCGYWHGGCSVAVEGVVAVAVEGVVSVVAAWCLQLWHGCCSAAWLLRHGCGGVVATAWLLQRGCGGCGCCSRGVVYAVTAWLLWHDFGCMVATA